MYDEWIAQGYELCSTVFKVSLNKIISVKQPSMVASTMTVEQQAKLLGTRNSPRGFYTSVEEKRPFTGPLNSPDLIKSASTPRSSPSDAVTRCILRVDRQMTSVMT